MKSIDYLIKFLFSGIICLTLLSSALYAQQKKQLAPADYKLWHKLFLKGISHNGKWVSYSMDYPSGNDTLFVKNVERNIKFAFSSGSKGNFSSDNKWFSYVKNHKAILINLKTGEKRIIPNAIRYSFSADGNYHVTLIGATHESNNKRNELIIIELETGKSHSIENVSEFALNPNGNLLAYTTNDKDFKSVVIIKARKSFKTTVVTHNKTNIYYRLTWHGTGESLVFFEELKDEGSNEKNNIIHFYSNLPADPILYSFDPLKMPGFPGKMRISGYGMATKLMVSDDQKRVFFSVQPWIRKGGLKAGVEKSTVKPGVQIWRANDKMTYPRKKEMGRWGRSPQLYTWWPEENKFLQIGTEKRPKVVLSGDQKYALTFNPMDYKPLFKYKEDYVDIYLINLKTGNERLFLEKQLYKFWHTRVSPGGRYIAYFKNRHWWIYDIELDTHTNISSALGVPVHNVDFDRAGTAPPYGSPGWIQGEKGIIVYDKYDTWVISPDGNFKEKLTHGREREISFRIYEKHYVDYIESSFFGFEGHCFNLSEGLMFEAYGNTTKQSGYFTWNSHSGLKELVFKDSYIHTLKKAKYTGSYIYLEEKFDMAPRLMHIRSKKDSATVVVQSNPQQESFYWGRSQLISYTNTEGEQLQGALFYPANYQAGKKYPMIVNIYERKSKELHHYVNPSEEMTNGFNLTSFTTEGYFVLLPDISYKINDPGISALQCVVAAVEEVLATGMIDRERIGLMGHSFGGYETSFIISRTDLFNAAVAGAPLTNLVSSYFGFVWNDKVPSFWRFEAQILRFEGSFFDHVDAYIRNSPLHNAEKINTPLLMWFGKKDGQVDWYQGIELHLALRRLEKEHVFLVYPEEGHHIHQKKNAKDLFYRIKDWFDYYLTGSEMAIWIENGK